MIKIRMARGGRKRKPVFTIVAADTRSPRDGRFIAKLGQYDPHASEPMAAIKTEEIKRWLNDGAQLSDSVKSLFKKYQITL